MNRNAQSDHPLNPLLSERWSPRSFTGEGIPRETIESCLEAARWAASCFNDQPWNFIVAPREDSDAFARAMDALMAGNQEWADKASVLMFGVVRPNFVFDGSPNKHAQYDLGQSVAQMTLQAWSLGIAVHQMGGFFPEKVRENFGVPETHEPLVAIALGPMNTADALPTDDLKEREQAPRTRYPQSDFVHWGKWS
jgi:nitroreductase